jgi:hypothetical protein
LCARLGLSKLRVPWDIDIHWNSTYRMFHRCFPYKHAITESLNNSTEGIHLLISEGEWDQLEMLKSFLGIFFTAIIKLSCSYTSSTHELLHHLYRIFKVNYLFFNLIHFNIYLFFYLIFFYILFYISSFSIFFSQKVYHEIEDIESLEFSLSPIVEAMKEKIITNYFHPSFKKKYTVRILQRYK